jgi:predicted NBD/HSP70 family sugar kinase
VLSITADILQIVRKAKQPISKKEIATASGLSVSAAADHVERLMDANLLVHAAIGGSSGGRKPRLYAFNKDAGHLISIDMDTASAQVAITNFDCSILAQNSCSFDIYDGPDKVLNHIKEVIFELLTQNRLDRSAIKGIGFGIPGPVEFASGLPISPTLMPGWDQYPIRKFWSEHFHCPCYIDNDVNIMALGEYAKGLVLEVDNMMIIKVGVGIGAGIICDGKLYRGSNGSAGDLGHFDVGRDVTCWCGNRGCLEAVAGGKAVVTQAKELALSGKGDYLLDMINKKGTLDMADIAVGIQRRDAVSIELNRESSSLIGRVVASIVNFLNPELILVSGAFSEFEDTLLAAIRQAVYKRSLPLSTRNLLINKSALGNKAGLIGAAYMTLEQLIINSINDQEDANLATG